MPITDFNISYKKRGKNVFFKQCLVARVEVGGGYIPEKVKITGAWFDSGQVKDI